MTDDKRLKEIKSTRINGQLKIPNGSTIDYLLGVIDRLKEENEKIEDKNHTCYMEWCSAQAKVEKLEAENKELEKRLNETEDKIDGLENELVDLEAGYRVKELEAENKELKEQNRIDHEEHSGNEDSLFAENERLEAKLKEAECDLVEWSYQMSSAIDIGGLDPKMALAAIEKILESIRDKGGKE